MNPRRVVVTGLGLVSPHGDEPGVVFDALMQGQTAIGPWKREGMPAVAAATAPFDVSRWFTKLQLAGVDRASQMAVAASESARRDAQWPDGLDPERIGVYVGSSVGGANAIESGYEAMYTDRRMPPLTIVASLANGPAAHVAMRTGVHGPVFTYAVACASSAVAIAEAGKAIACGDIDIAIAGGTEALLVPGTVRAWQALQTLATLDETEPGSSCRPFDATRSGLVLGEGAAMLVLESLESALARGAHIHAELAGSGVSCDATHVTKPDSAGQARALKNALRRAGLAPAQIGYCNAHGTATKVGDVVECESLRSVWQDAIETLQVSATKSMHGHLLGAAGALEALITVMALERGQIPPTASTRSPDPLCNVNVVRDRGVEAPMLRAAISNSFAFGGTNVVLAFTKVESGTRTEA